MFVQSAKSFVAAGMCWLQGAGGAVRLRTWKRKFWRGFAVSLSAVDGVLLVDKAEGMTSHDVVALLRRQLGIKKVGHCGTLDPLATGLLLLTIGRGTKVQDLLMSEDKEYVGTLELGATTSTQDREGDVLDVRPVTPFTQSEIETAFAKFKGDFYQM